MKPAIQNIPESLIYEMVNGKPIYYKGYKAYLKGEKQLGELMGSSYLQSLIVTRLVYLIISQVGEAYTVLSTSTK